MSDVLFIHSAGLQGETEGSGRLISALSSGLAPSIRFSAPMMPDPSNPNAATWDEALGKHLASLRAHFVLVGHSLGGSTILKYLAEHQAPPGLAGVISIAAPFWGMQGWDIPEFALRPGFAAPLSHLPRLVFYHSEDDNIAPIAHVDRYADALPRAQVRKVDGRGHAFDDGQVDDVLADIRFD
jgi:uncharacterized protein